jgi:hypothetical protein
MATLVPTTNPRGSTPVTRLSTTAAGATLPATGTIRMIDCQIRERSAHQLTQRPGTSATVRDTEMIHEIMQHQPNTVEFRSRTGRRITPR